LADTLADIESVVEELYDVMLLPGVIRPMLIRTQVRPAPPAS
jgi:hypothetical protein